MKKGANLKFGSKHNLQITSLVTQIFLFVSYRKRNTVAFNIALKHNSTKVEEIKLVCFKKGILYYTEYVNKFTVVLRSLFFMIYRNIFSLQTIKMRLYSS